ncbi:hypothetical protein HUG10_05950 [Halorarum halophilum]|uniref:Uncharacterized protein n=2 Tax=Halorarum halophilum TaxID=2743090 RepID=A0A7D5GK30_9EURY|nr:hypothetical protein HUG10_05950 [Halobaculum halophilum]
MRGRIGGSRLRTWVLLNASRWFVAALFSLSIFVVIVGASFLDLAPMRKVVRNQTALWWVFSPLISAVITGVTLVVTFTQLVLSQELGPLGDQRDRMNGAIEFRNDVESWLDVSPAPPDPSSFMEAVVDGIQDYARNLQTAADGCEDEPTREQVNDLAESLIEHAAAVGEGLEDATFGEFDVLYSALDFNYSWKIYEANRLRTKRADELDEDTTEAIDDIVEVLKFFGPAREHFKTLYFQWELINLSRVMLYAALPALVVTFLVQFYVSPHSFPGTYLGVDGLVWIVASGVTVALVPFFLLTSYVLRIATVAKRTLAIGPFILRDTDRSEDIDWE